MNCKDSENLGNENLPKVSIVKLFSGIIFSLGLMADIDRDFAIVLFPVSRLENQIKFTYIRYWLGVGLVRIVLIVLEELIFQESLQL